jgi:AmmeMemoRadiSam system protein B/AmmeMemoRadiSam system protein A
LRTASEIIRATTLGEKPDIADQLFEGTADQLVSGTFVTLKRGKHLRSCCGGLTEKTMTLADSLYDAAVRAACEDYRFPPLSVTELEHLDVEVWLLFNPQPILTRGEERASSVIVGGKHGLVISRGEARGLLLPGVAAENGWDARHFLEHVCIKAGLHSSLWKDDDTTLLTFEGESFQCRLREHLSSDAPAAASFFVERESLRGLVEYCRGNIQLMLEGRTPMFYATGSPDGSVSGVAMTVTWPGAQRPLQFFQFSLRPGLPLQSTLFSLCQASCRAIAGLSLDQDKLSALTVELILLSDPSMHGTLRDPDLAGIKPTRRAVMVLDRNRAGLAFDAKAGTQELLDRARAEAKVAQAATAGIFSFDAIATQEKALLYSGPKASIGPSVRPAAVAGTFYPADPAELGTLLDKLLEGSSRVDPWPAAMVPHAGLRFSGSLAAKVLKRLSIPDTVIVLGPKHTPLGVDWAVTPHQTWSLPATRIESDPELARELASAIPGLELDSTAHQREHAIEVELPFIARLAPEARVVGIVIGHGDLSGCRKFAAGLARVLKKREKRPLLLVSSDMNHFATDQETRKLDELAMCALEGMDPEDIYKTVRSNGITMCGLLPAVIVLETLRLLGGGNQAERVGYATSADVTGDPTRVVGYAGMLFK